MERGAPHLGHLSGGQLGGLPSHVHPHTEQRHFAILKISKNLKIFDFKILLSYNYLLKTIVKKKIRKYLFFS